MNLTYTPVHRSGRDEVACGVKLSSKDLARMTGQLHDRRLQTAGAGCLGRVSCEDHIALIAILTFCTSALLPLEALSLAKAPVDDPTFCLFTII